MSVQKKRQILSIIPTAYLLFLSVMKVSPTYFCVFVDFHLYSLGAKDSCSENNFYGESSLDILDKHMLK